MKSEIFVPRLMDAAQRNPQNTNARMLLARWAPGDYSIRTLTYDEPESRVAARPGVRIVRLWRRHAWQAHVFFQYLRTCDAVFYPGVAPADFAGLRSRRLLGLRGPIVATLEGLVGDAERERFYSSAAGHAVQCQPVTGRELKRCDRILEMADHIIAISPFLARMGRERYGDKFSVLPLGVDPETFHPPEAEPRARAGTLRVVSAGRVTAHKRPEVFLSLASRHSNANFTWFGDGDQRAALLSVVASRGLKNLAFPGACSQQELADALRQADVFVLPSRAEGVPKVTQEAAACGLPVVVFGHYEAPSVEHERNGFVVWSDEELIARVGQLLDDEVSRQAMGRQGREMMRELGWDAVAPRWERTILGWLGKGRPARVERR